MIKVRFLKIKYSFKLFFIGCVALLLLGGCYGLGLNITFPVLTFEGLNSYGFFYTVMSVANYSFSSRQTVDGGGLKYTFSGSDSGGGQPSLSVTVCSGVALFTLHDPLIIQLPEHVYVSEGSYESQNGELQEGNLTVRNMASVPVTPELDIYAEPGHRIYVVDFPDGVEFGPVGGKERQFSLRLQLVNTQQGTNNHYQAKVISTVKVDLDGALYYLPIYPMETDFSKLPAIALGGPSGSKYEVEIPDMSAFTLPETISYDLRASGRELHKLYYPHIDCSGDWETELVLFNDNAATSLSGTLIIYSDFGNVLSGVPIDELPARGRREFSLNELVNCARERPGYAVFEHRTENQVKGFAKLSISGRFRTAIPAQSDSENNAGDLLVPHVASGGEWWTGISLINTNPTAQRVVVETNIEDDSSWSLTFNLAPGERTYFTFADMAHGESEQKLPLITSATVTRGAGIIGVELFGSKVSSVNKYLGGLLLRDDTTTTMYYPHTVSDDLWWTGVVGYNPGATTARVFITPYSSAGEELSDGFTGGQLTINSKDKYLGAVSNLNFPPETAWFKLESTQPLTGFELFGKVDGTQLAGYTSCNIDQRSGIFPKLEKSGWTGIAFVNVGEAATVYLNAYNNDGQLVASTETLELVANEKKVAVVEELFSGDISSATYITFDSESPIVGFQLNASSDGMLLDALPGLPKSAF